MRIQDNLLLPGDKALSVYMKESQGPARACIIWMHGLGADASDMAGLAEQLSVTGVRHVFMNAPNRPVTINGGMMMPAWYDILGMQLVDRADTKGIAESEALIHSVMDSQLKDGFTADKIFLAGFSQGGAMALHTALNYSARLAGVIALSAYLPLGTSSTTVLDTNTPFFMGSGTFDPVVLPVWTKMSQDFIVSKGYKTLSYHEYPMEHSICLEELNDLNTWLSAQIMREVV